MGNQQGQVAPQGNENVLSQSKLPLIFTKIKVHHNANSVDLLEALAYVNLGESLVLSRSSVVVLTNDVDINSELSKAEEKLINYLNDGGNSILSKAEVKNTSNQPIDDSSKHTLTGQETDQNLPLDASEEINPDRQRTSDQSLAGDILVGEDLCGDALSGDALNGDVLITFEPSSDSFTEKPLLDLLDKKLLEAGKTRDDFDINYELRSDVKKLISDLTPSPSEVY